LNEIIVNVILKSIPKNIKPVNYLMDLLELSRESVYRRIRREIPFSMEEITKLSLTLGFSIDEIVEGSKKERKFFDLQILSDFSETYIWLFKEYDNYLQNILNAKKNRVLMALNHIPPLFSTFFDNLSKFFYYKWLNENIEDISNRSFADLHIPNELVLLQEKISINCKKINVVMILSPHIFLSTIKDIQYFYRRKLPHLRETCSDLERLVKAVSRQKNIETLRGIEGSGAAGYFAALSSVFQTAWSFSERNRRPPRDPINALLSFGYTLLLGSVTTAVILVGLDPCVGFIHPEYRGRPSLPLDMMEEFRSPIIDRMVISSCNQGIFKANNFERTEDGGVLMNAAARKTLLELYDNRLRTPVKNDSTGERANYETHLRSQAAMLVRRLRGHSEYLPFVCAN
jgi:CRISPR/Cas system-associated endonuclease Cas1